MAGRVGRSRKVGRPRAKRIISVKLAHLARALQNIKVEAGATVREMLDKAGVSASGDIFVNGTRAGMTTKLKDGDIIGIVGQVTGGRV